MKLKYAILVVALAFLALACKNESSENQAISPAIENAVAFDYNVEQFADIKVLRYQIPGWENLSLANKN